MDKNIKRLQDVLNKYNEISEKKLKYPEYLIVFSKLKLILEEEVELDDIELIELIDVILEFNKYHQSNRINKETIGLIKRITKNDLFNLEGTLYFAASLKHLLLPYNFNKCTQEYNMLLHISQLEVLLGMIVFLDEKSDYELIQKYNYELSEVFLQYSKAMNIYSKKGLKEIVLSTIILHLCSIFYFSQDEYNQNYEIIATIVKNSIDNYEEFINYCYNEGVYNNFKQIVVKEKDLQNEYRMCKQILDYVYQKEEKRKCKI